MNKPQAPALLLYKAPGFAAALPVVCVYQPAFAESVAAPAGPTPRRRTVVAGEALDFK